MEMNILYCGDCMDVMQTIDSDSIDLIYADPPFYTQRDFVAFNDKFDSMDVYIDFVRARMEECYRVLKSTGSIYVHLDWHASHYLKIEMDKIFGYKNYKTEITWRRCHPKGNAKTFANNTDHILYYTKSNKFTFNIQYGEYSEKTLSLYKYNDNDGKGDYRTVAINAPGGNGYKYDLGYGEKCPDSGYRWTEKTMLKKIADNRVILKRGNVPVQKRYLSESKGVPFDNVWTDIENVTAPLYPTEKPEKLLERIILSSSNEGDIVFDPFAGCATTMVTAQKLGRRWIGIDINPEAIEMSRKRMSNCNHQLTQM